MIAVVLGENGEPPCKILVTGRSGFKVKSKTYCGREVDASGGVYQLPDGVKTCDECEKKIPEILAALAR